MKKLIHLLAGLCLGVVLLPQADYSQASPAANTANINNDAAAEEKARKFFTDLEVIDQNGNKLELNSEGITLESAGDLTIKASGDLKLEGANIEVSASGNLTATGSAGAEVSSSGITTLQGSLVNIN